MKIIYQGSETETAATTVAEFLKGRGTDAKEAVIELDGEIVSSIAVAGTPLHEGAELNAYRIVAGG